MPVGAVPDLLATDFSVPATPGLKSRRCAGSDTGFFCDLIESRAYARADPEKGRFRSFLLGALKHFVAHARAHDRTQKRGGGMIVGPLDTAAIAEADARAVGSPAWSAERVYEREWAETLLRQALDRLAEECALAGKDELFEQLNSHLSVSSEAAVPYEEMSLRLGRPITTLRSDVAGCARDIALFCERKWVAP